MAYLKRTRSKPDIGTSISIKRVLITDKVDPILVDILKKGGLEVSQEKAADEAELIKLLENFDALIVRSATKVTGKVIESSCKTLKLIGRAGTGVDNIDVKAATKCGVLVMNTPGANTISAAEHTVALLMAVARNIQQAALTFKGQHKWARSALSGTELQGKTIGILGLGRIGREVAKRCQGFEMTTIGYDPVMPPEISIAAGIKPMSLEEVLARSDILSVHTPLLDSTRGLIGKKTLPLCKDGVIVINCARGGIVDEDDLYDALESGKVGGAGLDVFVEEPPKDIPGNKLVNHPKCTVTPHLGASTQEAQSKVAQEIANQFLAISRGESSAGTINAPALSCAFDSEAKPWLTLAYSMGSIIGQLLTFGSAQLSVDKLGITVQGPKLAKHIRGLKSASLAGFLNEFSDDRVNMVNADGIAERMKIDVSMTNSDHPDETYQNLFSVEYKGSQTKGVLRAAVFHDSGRIVQIDDNYLELVPEGTMLVIRNKDKPGVAARISAILFESNINISYLVLGRNSPVSALTIIGLDSEPPQECLDKMLAFDDITFAGLVHVPDV
mmetsp:Transcript_6894/g.19505  ORF Transcript_6894/g.19505 Transcript_6894/m.19505 type:complete len:557 (+) Transcript_6894:166-1836(+)|eukprot:CAMPEP_0119132918 /NCGR_PEP_ID=MMETSP1310-20130426/12589_1 /TAXON_ID=464262 /ORGANISM="Genus nov. species nov., Strain RCC2339" /LENGTH=556 /DNA_ID=CAMNT_0007123585 /DNA_START=165 /DNA_END=1835 /DNA_ORIENTATION=-